MRFEDHKVIPVIKINDANKAEALARALLDGGIAAVEITLRTEAGLHAIKRIAEGVPEMTVGAGSVLDKAQAEAAYRAGAEFIVSPGFDRGILDYCRDTGVPYLPGCSSATEIQAAANLGCETVKFFPAEALGGAKTVAALSAPFPGMRFMPTGGINGSNAAPYFKLKCVGCVGAGSIAPETLIDSSDFAKITENAKRFISAVNGAPELCRAKEKNGGRTVVTLGEIMLRLSPPYGKRIVQSDCFDVNYGGAEANVAVSLALFGENVRYVTKLPENAVADASVYALRKYGVDTSYIVRGGERMGLYYLEKGASQRSSKVIYDRAGSAMAEAGEDDFDFERIFDNAGWFHLTGITPAISEKAAAVCRKAVSEAQKRGVTVSMDLNYRKKLWDVETAAKALNGLLPGVDVLICNEEHASKICSVRCDEDLAGTAKLLCEKYGFTSAAVTRRRTESADINTVSAAAYVNGEKAYSPAFRCDIVDRVGSGDAFAAGFIYSLLHGQDAEKAAAFACAASALKHSVEGDFNLMTVREIEAAAGGATGKTER